MSLILFLIVGLAAGWLAGVVMKGKGFGMLGNMIVGTIGAFLGWLLFKFIGLLVYGLIGTLIMAFVGVVVLLFIIRLVKKA
ncbi:GlsB/YeaQ/YmgE family stress response membrane protein [candidate division KSB1 bacterium]|nr:GlsB/YeaQ/YmgE family stress response membrane protein [candidate division KSB1 bacterium]